MARRGSASTLGAGTRCVPPRIPHRHVKFKFKLAVTCMNRKIEYSALAHGALALLVDICSSTLGRRILLSLGPYGSALPACAPCVFSPPPASPLPLPLPNPCCSKGEHQQQHDCAPLPVQSHLTPPLPCPSLLSRGWNQQHSRL